jgi:hypothetical protein
VTALAESSRTSTFEALASTQPLILIKGMLGAFWMQVDFYISLIRSISKGISGRRDPLRWVQVPDPLAHTCVGSNISEQLKSVECATQCAIPSESTVTQLSSSYLLSSLVLQAPSFKCSDGGLSQRLSRALQRGLLASVPGLMLAGWDDAAGQSGSLDSRKKSRRGRLSQLDSFSFLNYVAEQF